MVPLVRRILIYDLCLLTFFHLATQCVQNIPYYVAYQIKENHECSNMVTIILLADTLTLRMGQLGQNLPFSEHGHIVISI